MASMRDAMQDNDAWLKLVRSRQFWLWAAAAISLALGGAYYYLHDRPVSKPAAVHPVAIAPVQPKPEVRPKPAPAPVPETEPKKQASSETSSQEPPQEKPHQELNTLKIEKHQAKTAINPISEKGYRAMMAHDLAGAQRDYARLLAQDPQSRDALFGLAAVAMKRGRADLAERYYEKVLEIDPDDPLATASLVDLGNVSDGESRLKIALQRSPDSGALYFSLGNRYASESAWAEAKQAYFEAYRRDESNPDFAFNLAVSCDHLGQAASALRFYRKAIALSSSGFAGFDIEAAKKRVDALEAVHGG
jgi:tetratricopeptide (TPR) repeat protein